MDSNTRLRLKDDVSHQSLGPGQDTVVLSLSSGFLYTCNETTADFLSAVDGERTLGQIVEFMGEKYNASPEVLTRDMTKLADHLIEEGLIVAQPPDSE